jgi:3-hydroxyisobutyrate dehydrogenase-like beta-hydroxyacid dehydrogenase
MAEVARRGAASAADRRAVGFLGLGRMGWPMATNLARAGFPLSVFNRTHSTAERFAEGLGGTVAACRTPGEVARRSDVVITMLADGEAVQEVFLGENGVLTGIRPGSVAIDMSTISPEEARELGKRVRAAGASFIDAPVSGSVALAESGSLTIMAAGDAGEIDRVRAVLESMGSSIVTMGPSGLGAVMKLAVNTVVYGLNQSLSEALVMAEKAGIDRAVAYAVFADSAIAAPFVHYRRDAFERPEGVQVAFRLALARKDLDLILELAGRVGADLPQAVANQEVLRHAAEAGFEDEDVSAVARYLRGEAGPLGAGRTEGGVQTREGRT